MWPTEIWCFTIKYQKVIFTLLIFRFHRAPESLQIRHPLGLWYFKWHSNDTHIVIISHHSFYPTGVEWLSYKCSQWWVGVRIPILGVFSAWFFTQTHVARSTRLYKAGRLSSVVKLNQSTCRQKVRFLLLHVETKRKWPVGSRPGLNKKVAWWRHHISGCLVRHHAKADDDFIM